MENQEWFGAVVRLKREDKQKFAALMVILRGNRQFSAKDFKEAVNDAVKSVQVLASRSVLRLGPTASVVTAVLKMSANFRGSCKTAYFSAHQGIARRLGPGATAD